MKLKITPDTASLAYRWYKRSKMKTLHPLIAALLISTTSCSLTGCADRDAPAPADMTRITSTIREYSLKPRVKSYHIENFLNDPQQAYSLSLTDFDGDGSYDLRVDNWYAYGNAHHFTTIKQSYWEQVRIPQRKRFAHIVPDSTDLEVLFPFQECDLNE